MERELIHELIAGYTLDALDDSERREFEQHLASCERCAEELEGLRAAAAALAYIPEGPAPPPALRDRLLRQVHAEHAAAEPRSNVVLLRRRWALPALATFGTVAAAAAVVLGIWAASLSSSLDRQDAIAGVLGNVESRHVDMGAGNRLIVSPDGQAVLVSGIARAPQGKTYELWVIQAGEPRPAGLFAEGKSASPFLLSRRVPLGAKISLSIERHGGAKRPTHILDVSPPI